MGGRAEDAVREARLALNLPDQFEPAASYERQGTPANETWRSALWPHLRRCAHRPTVVSMTMLSPSASDTAAPMRPRSSRTLRRYCSDEGPTDPERPTYGTVGIRRSIRESLARSRSAYPHPA
jgi:hypothetical protein